MKNNKTYTFSQFALAEEFNEDSAFELLHTGENTDPRYGDFRFSKDELEEMASNFNEGVRGVEIAVDINHDPQKRAYAWIQPGSMYVAESSKLDGEYSLYGKLHRYTEEGKKLLRDGSYRYFSLEIKPSLTTVINKIKKTFRNVITGLAFTNSPVIKGLNATYSEKELLPNTHNMKEFKALVTELLQKGHATLSEKEQAADLFIALSAEQQGQLQKQLSELDGLPEEPKEAPAEQETDVAPSAPETVPAEEPVAPAEPVVEPVAPTVETALAEDDVASKQLAESMRLAEEVRTLKEQNLKFAEEIRGAKVSQQVKSLMLSESRPVGIAPGTGNANESRLTRLMMSLSEDQASELVALLSEVRSVDFKEHGKNVGELSLSEKESLLDETADEILVKNPSMAKHDALTAAAKQLGLDKA